MFKNMFERLVNWIKKPVIEVTIETITEKENSDFIDYGLNVQDDIIKKLSEHYNVKCTVRDNGHVTLQKDFTVSYWPYSKKRTAYVHGAAKSVKNCTAKDAILMTMKRNDIEKAKS